MQIEESLRAFDRQLGYLYRELGLFYGRRGDCPGHQSLGPLLFARRQEDRLADSEAAVLPTAYILDDFRFDLALGQIQGEDCFSPRRTARLRPVSPCPIPATPGTLPGV